MTPEILKKFLTNKRLNRFLKENGAYAYFRYNVKNDYVISDKAKEATIMDDDLINCAFGWRSSTYPEKFKSYDFWANMDRTWRQYLFINGKHTVT